MQFSPRYRTLRRLLRNMRKDAGLTQKELAAAIGKVPSFVSKAELGERSIDVYHLIDICEACGVSVPKAFAALCKESSGRQAKIKRKSSTRKARSHR